MITAKHRATIFITPYHYPLSLIISKGAYGRKCLIFLGKNKSSYKILLDYLKIIDRIEYLS